MFPLRCVSCRLYLLQATHDALVGGRAQNTHFPFDTDTCCAACATIIVSKMDGNSPHSDHVQPSDTTVKAPEFDLFLALLIVTEAELLVQFPFLLTARGRNNGLVLFPALQQQRRTTGPFSFPPDSNGGRIIGTVSFPPDSNGGRIIDTVSFPPDSNGGRIIGTVSFPPDSNGGRIIGTVSFPPDCNGGRIIGTVSFPPDCNGGRIIGTVSFPPDGNGGRTTGPVSFPPDGNREELLVQFPSHLSATAPEHSRRVVAALELLRHSCTDFVSVCS